MTLKLNSESNALVRILSGDRLKFTCRVHKPDGSVIEWQSAAQPTVKWQDEARALWVFGKTSEYDQYPVIEWQTGMILLCEINPEAKP